MQNIISTNDVKNYLDLDIQDATSPLVVGMVAGCTEVVCDYLGYEVIPDSTRHTEIYSLESSQAILRPRFRPLWKVIDIWVDTDRIWASTDRLDSTAYYVNKKTDCIEFDGRQSRGPGSLKITYDGGWKTTTSPLPASIWLRTLQLFALYWYRDHVGKPKEGHTQGPRSEKEILDALRRYRTRPVG